MTTTPKSHGARFTAGLALLLALPALAQAAKTPNPNNGHGKITAVSATSITVTPKAGTAKTFTIDGKTKVTLDGKDATVTDLNTTQHAQVKSKDGTLARRIIARDKGYKKPAGTKTDPIAPAPL